MPFTINTQQLPSEVQKKLHPYLEKMCALHGDNLVSIMVYGSATGTNYVSKVSDINTVCVFKDLNFQVFQKSVQLVSGGIKKRIAAPLFLTREYIHSSLDVFPIEFLDMKENHVLAFGEDVFSSLDIKGEHIRLFCEQQIKGKLIRIRQAYLEIGSSRRGMEELLKESLNALLPIFRNLLRLREQSPSTDKMEMIQQFCQAYNLDDKIFIPIYKDKTNDEKIAGQDVVVFLEKYIHQIQQLAVKVDQL